MTEKLKSIQTGSLEICGMKLETHVLNNGERVIEAERNRKMTNQFLIHFKIPSANANLILEFQDGKIDVENIDNARKIIARRTSVNPEQVIICNIMRLE